jgi:CO dehydrogenase nickel-insertion accessory protein CooC1
VEGIVLLALWSPKGGVGTSVLVAATAMAVARDGIGVRVADLVGDQPAVFGLGADPTLGLADWLAAGPEAPGEALDRLVVEVATGVGLLPRGAERDHAVEQGSPGEAGRALAAALRAGAPVIADCGTATDPASRAVVESADAGVMVLRPCYLALRRAVHAPLLQATRGVVVVEEPGRVLGTKEITEVLDLPVIARVPMKAAIARAVDAGVLATRLPEGLDRAAMQLATGTRWCEARRRGAAA